MNVRNLNKNEPTKFPLCSRSNADSRGAAGLASPHISQSPKFSYEFPTFSYSVIPNRSEAKREESRKHFLLQNPCFSYEVPRFFGAFRRELATFGRKLPLSASPPSLRTLLEMRSAPQLRKSFTQKTAGFFSRALKGTARRSLKKTVLPNSLSLKFLAFVFSLFLLSSSYVSAQRKKYYPIVHPITQENSRLLTRVLHRHPEYFADILENPDKYRVQIIFTQINRDKYNRPYVKHHTFNLDTTMYFFPASMVKMPVAFLALEKKNLLQLEGYEELDEFSPMETRAKGPCETNTKRDPSSPTGYPYLAHYIKKVFLVSNNPAYDKLYEFVGPCEINRKLHEKGYTSAHIVQRYGRYCSYSGNMQTPEIIFRNSDGKIIYKQAAMRCKGVPPTNLEPDQCSLGKGYFNSSGRIVRKPMNFCRKNYVNLKDLHEMLMAVMLPAAVPRRKRFKLRRSDYKLLHKYMSMYPTESKHPNYSSKHPTLVKYLYYGGRMNDPKDIDPDVRIFNKVGMSYGFLVDCAYFIDFKRNVEFFLSATIYVNRDGILNDGMYDYISVGLPFMRNLGREIMKLERRRRKPRKANLDFYKHNYQEEDELP